MEKKIKIGDWVIAKQKSIFPESWNDFLKDYPLAIAQVKEVYTPGGTKHYGAKVELYNSISGKKCSYAFKFEDLEVIDE